MDLLRRDWAPAVTLELVGPERLTGESVARTWSAAPGRTVTYGGGDAAVFERQMAAYGPSWLAYDMRPMMAGIQKVGMHGAEGAADPLQGVSGGPAQIQRLCRGVGSRARVACDAHCSLPSMSETVLESLRQRIEVWDNNGRRFGPLQSAVERWRSSAFSDGGRPARVWGRAAMALGGRSGDCREDWLAAVANCRPPRNR